MVVYTFEVCVKGQREPKKLKFGVGVEMCVSHNMKCASVVTEDELLCFDNGTTVPGLSPEYSLGKSKFI